jgi:hypothetical protein
MHPKRLKAFFQIMSRNEFSVTNFEILKKQVILDHRLAHNCFADVVVNEILANIQYRNNPPVKMIFNESIFSSISEKDVMDYFETHYKKCHLSVIVSGAIHKKDAIEALRSAFGRQPPRETIPSEDVCSNDDEIMKEITIRNKHVGKSVQYFYKIPKNNIALSNSFFDILNYELFDFFEKINTMVSGYSCYNVISNGDCIKQIVFYPKFDVALADFQVAYNVFVDRVHKRKISSETFAKIMLLKKYSNQFSKQNLDETYSKIRSDYINNLNEENEITSPEQFSALSSDFLGSNLILKIITRYKSDK